MHTRIERCQDRVAPSPQVAAEGRAAGALRQPCSPSIPLQRPADHHGALNGDALPTTSNVAGSSPRSSNAPIHLLGRHFMHFIRRHSARGRGPCRGDEGFGSEPTIIKTTSFRSDRRLREGFAVRCLTSHRKSRCDGAKIGNKRNQSESWREVALRGNALMTDNACYRTP